MQKPFLRDTTPNPPGEIARRLAIVLHGAGLLGGLLLLAFGTFGERKELVIFGSILVAVGLGLHFTRARWRDGNPPRGVAGGRPGADNADAAAAMPPSPQSAVGRPRILLLNAALGGAEGNSARLLARVAARLGPRAELVRATLAGPEGEGFTALAPKLRQADGWVIATGTHWDSWSSPLQKFLEDGTSTELSGLWLGKPVAVLVSEHSTGGKGVLSRLQGVLATLGCWIPPLSGIVISKSAEIAARADAAAADDFWSIGDLDVVADNLLMAARQPRLAWRVWPVDRVNFSRVWVESSGRPA